MDTSVNQPDTYHESPDMKRKIAALMRERMEGALDQSGVAEGVRQAPSYEVDISADYDTASQANTVWTAVKELPFYREGLLFAGFDADNPASLMHMDEEESDASTTFATERQVMGFEEGDTNPLEHTAGLEHGAIAVLDPAKVTEADQNTGSYYVNDPSAIVAVVRLK